MLTKKDVNFEWSEHQGQAFKELKKAIRWHTSTQANEHKLISILVGLVMIQHPPNDPKNKQIVLFANRSLTPIEQSYSQVEREALVCEWVMEKLNLNFFGQEFDLVTDNKIVKLLPRNRVSKPKA